MEFRALISIQNKRLLSGNGGGSVENNPIFQGTFDGIITFQFQSNHSAKLVIANLFRRDVIVIWIIRLGKLYALDSNSKLSGVFHFSTGVNFSSLLHWILIFTRVKLLILAFKVYTFFSSTCYTYISLLAYKILKNKNCCFNLNIIGFIVLFRKFYFCFCQLEIRGNTHFLFERKLYS